MKKLASKPIHRVHFVLTVLGFIAPLKLIGDVEILIKVKQVI